MTNARYSTNSASEARAYVNCEEDTARPAIGTLFSSFIDFSGTNWLRVVGYSRTMVRFQPVPTIMTYDLYGGSCVVDMQWLLENPADRLNGKYKGECKPVVFNHEHGYWCIAWKVGRGDRFTEDHNPTGLRRHGIA
jgi:hypothetical protein